MTVNDAPVPAVPTLQEVATALGKTPNDITAIYYAEAAAQARRCRVDPYTADLAAALVRRVKRAKAMEALPLGVIQAEMGATRVGSVDPEVRRLEGPYVRTPFG